MKILFTILSTVYSKKVNTREIDERTFYQKLVMIKKDHEDLENSTNFWVCNNVHIDCDD